jgi:thymidine phosphorylase
MSNMDAAGIIWRLRNGCEPNATEMAWLAQGIADHGVSDAQAGAFAMAVCLNGLTSQARSDLTLAMRDSGTLLSWPVDGPVLDKHSTGGVGDCVSLILAPMLAALGVYVPMISGRGLGHTGGTLDKLEAIPGVNVTLDQDRMQAIVKQCGCVIAGASANLAPADRRLYAIRDVTGTVDSIDLITASILSKKLAAGIDGLVLDVKCGTGAFMKTQSDAEALARSLVDVANLAGCPTTALITDMNQPLAPALGNALEINAVMQVLGNGVRGRLSDAAIALGAELLARQGLYELEQAKIKLADVLDDGKAADVFGEMIRLMGGPLSFVDQWTRYLPEAPVIVEVAAPQDGYITQWNGTSLGECVVALGGGRRIETDAIDPAVGLDHVAPINTYVAKGQPIARIHAARIETAKHASNTILGALQIGENPTKNDPLIIQRIE